MKFLHHILSLTSDDPVNLTYIQQLKYPDAPNWANEVRQLRMQYEIEDTDDSIRNATKQNWKKRVKQKVREKALKDLTHEARGLKQISNISHYSELKEQGYIVSISPKLARCIFHMRTGTIDLRGVRNYKYGDNTTCRLCQTENETVEHVLNSCEKIERERNVNIFSTDCEELKEAAKRCIIFQEKVEELFRGRLKMTSPERGGREVADICKFW